MKKQITILTIALLAFSGSVAIASAAGLSISPASATKIAGDALNVSVNLSTGGNKVCVVTGTISFTNVTCQSITVASGLMAQMAPSCANPSFSIGIPSCTTADTSIISVNTVAGTAGAASVSLSDVDVIGEGKDVSTSGTGGTFTITAKADVPVVKPADTVDTKPQTIKTPAVKPLTKPTIIAPSEPTESEQATTTVQPTIEKTQPNTTQTAAAEASANGGISWITIFGGLILVIVGYAIGSMKKK